MTIKVRNAPVPSFLHRTAWKEDRTEGLVMDALHAGFRGFDSANQRKHCHEEGVGQAVQTKLREGLIRREELFLQTKFTFRDGQDDRLPYDAAAPIADQVAQSLASSLQHFGVDAHDSLILHGPRSAMALAPSITKHGGRWRQSPIWVGSSFSARATSPRGSSPSSSRLARSRSRSSRTAAMRTASGIAQSARYADENAIVYQGFSLLTANQHVLVNPKVAAIAANHRTSPPQIVFRFAQQIGMLPITGMSDPKHMRQDLDIVGIELHGEELVTMDRAGR